MHSCAGLSGCSSSAVQQRRPSGRCWPACCPRWVNAGLTAPALPSMATRRRRAFRVTLHAPDDKYDWRALEGELGAAFSFAEPARYYCNHAVLTLGASQQEFFDWLDDGHRELGTFGFGERIEVFKDVGLPDAVARRFDLAHRSGTHALGHTRMATESAVTTEHSHPFSTGLDLCLVHNGSLSNHNRWRQSLRREGIRFATDNDTEVAAGYLTWRLAQGMSLTQALETALADLDGFYTFAVGTRDGFAILRDH